MRKISASESQKEMELGELDVIELSWNRISKDER